MRMDQLNCPACSAPITFAPSATHVRCAFCGVTSRVQRGFGNAALLVDEQMTNSHVEAKPALTAEELRRIQLPQELADLERRLASLQSEIRALQRLPTSKNNSQQLRRLLNQEQPLVSRKAEIEAILYPNRPPAPLAVKGKGNWLSRVGLIVGAVFVVGWSLMLFVGQTMDARESRSGGSGAATSKSATSTPSKVQLAVAEDDPLEPVIFKIGENVTVGELRWRVTNAQDMGNELKSDNQFVEPKDRREIHRYPPGSRKPWERPHFFFRRKSHGCQRPTVRCL